MSCGVGPKSGSDLALLWLWHRPAAAAPIRPLAQELTYGAGEILKKKSPRTALLDRDFICITSLKKDQEEPKKDQTGRGEPR